ncbi:hypothetical protein J2W35_004968 [Variovorax boronicumulans]|nr:hypothetical protein [Variovorax boronicumulans]
MLTGSESPAASVNAVGTQDYSLSSSPKASPVRLP